MNSTSTLGFIFSSHCRNLTEGFYGYAFSGSDLIIGNEGYRQFGASGGSFEYDADGCYAEVKGLTDGTWRVSTDFRGHYPVFYYFNGTSWAVSPSIEELTKLARKCGWPLTVRRHQLEAFKSSRALTLQLSSSRTVFDEIYSLANDEEIIIDRYGLNVVAKARGIESLSYEDALGQMVGLWSARFRTIVDSGFNARIDLSGGVDSRAILSVLLWGISEGSDTLLLSSDRVRINSSKSIPEDYEVASNIAAAFGFPLNHKSGHQVVAASGGDALAEWKYFNLGRYAPHILPTAAQAHGVFYFPGTGGEDHRPFYTKFYEASDPSRPAQLTEQIDGQQGGNGALSSEQDAKSADDLSFDTYLETYAKVFSTRELFKLWAVDIYDDLAKTSSPFDVDLPNSMKHYRRHRSRHHSSKKPGSDLMASIFGSKAFYECTYHSSLDRILANQVLFDVMLTCTPELALMPYDRPGKGPTEKSLANATAFQPTKRSRGKVYCTRETLDPQVHIETPNETLSHDLDRILADQEFLTRLDAGVSSKIIAQQDRLKKRNNLHDKGSMLHYCQLSFLTYSCTQPQDNNSFVTPTPSSYLLSLLSRGPTAVSALIRFLVRRS